ncbi:MAG: hypothetical protein JWM78_1810 [Verrucomicrobiaceae bacterium]|nr:hypothetical protein [Verrucomicrobiaceae bacterium]
MIYQGPADVSLSTPSGERSETRQVIVNDPDALPAGAPDGLHVHTAKLTITVQGAPMKGVHEATEIEALSNAGSFKIDLLSADKIQISNDETQFSA